MKSITVLLVSLFSFSLLSQVKEQDLRSRMASSPFCGQETVIKTLKEKSPERYQKYIERKNQSNQLLDKADTRGTIYTIPVVFHILHDNGPENISEVQILDAMDILNRDFRKLNPDVVSIIPEFQNIAGDAEIHFELATVAPDGTCFNGITRTESLETYNDDDYGGWDQLQAVLNGNDVYQGYWPYDKYLNIIVAKKIISGAAGYTYLPYTEDVNDDPSNLYFNSIYILNSYVGSIGTSMPITSRTLTHEVGHWLNLNHIWGDEFGVCGDDEVADTPETEGSSGCDLNLHSCDGTLDNVQNYMNYSYCRVMFTQGQVDRMRATLEGNLEGRSNLWTTSNLEQTGVFLSNLGCLLKIQANQYIICEGGSTTFAVTGSNETILSYAWSFPGGSPATSTSANPSVSYASSGEYDVEVIITTLSGTNTVYKTGLITVSASPSTFVSLPIVEGFTGVTFPPADWSIENGGNPSTWKKATKGVAPTVGNSTMLDFDPANGAVNTSGDIDILHLPYFSLENMSSASLSFDVAYRPYGSTIFDDELQVLISPSCGMPYVIYDKKGAILGTEPASIEPYLDPINWRNEVIDLTPYVGGVVQIAFKGISGWGTIVYIDNINIQETTGTTNIYEELDQDFTIYPNPTSGKITLTGSNAMNIVSIYENSGRLIKTIEVNHLKEIEIDLSYLSKGIYYVQMVGEGYALTKKVAVE
ncbi:MAG: choice-of-anchor J domain-containing protein [Brumimicrobium sp.]|nr:choice-of-anchor J domain-containing protein [Brumimicrobium sp.]